MTKRIEGHCRHGAGIRSGIALAFGAAMVIGGLAGGARAYDDAVVKNCTDDYFVYCRQHAPESAELRYCMEAHRNQLSKLCVKALVDAGEVPKKYLTNQISDRR